MPLRNRAAQFMPFAALTGYEAEIEKSARLTEEARNLPEDSEDALNRKIQSVQAVLQAQEHPEISVTYFRPDDKKPGGAYIIKEGAVKKIDQYTGKLLFLDGTEIPLCGIIEISIKDFLI